MKRQILILIVFSLCVSLNAQNYIYKTLEDYKNNNYEEYDKFITTIGSAKAKVKFEIAGKDVILKCDDFWGFTYKGALFRNTTKWSIPVRLISDQKICYYENGLAHLQMLRDNKSTGEFGDGGFCYFSEDIEAEIVSLPLYYSMLAEKDISKFREDHPQYKSLFDCIGQNYGYEKVRSCMAKYLEEE